jgi:Tfp pilus assembly protein PilN
MIRINLLGVPKQKRGKRAAVSMTVLPSEGPSVLFVMLMVAALFLGANGFYYWRITQQRDQLATDLQKAEAENRMLADVKAKFLEKQKQADQYKRRVDVIDQLRSNQMGPVILLSMVGDTVNKTDAVWLTKVGDDGNAVSIEGTALSANAVANLMFNLKKSGYFKSVEMKETIQDEKVKEMQAFNFVLTCEKQVEKKS